MCKSNKITGLKTEDMVGGLVGVGVHKTSIDTKKY